MRKITSGAKRQDSVFFITENGIIMSAYCARTLAFQYGVKPEIRELSRWVMHGKYAAYRAI